MTTFANNNQRNYEEQKIQPVDEEERKEQKDIVSEDLSAENDMQLAIARDPVAAARAVLNREKETTEPQSLKIDVEKANEHGGKKGGLLTSERKRLHEFEELDQMLQHG